MALTGEKAYVVLEVSNSGQTIEGSAWDQIFQPLQRGSAPITNSDTAAGLGLGLYIVREVALAHGNSSQPFQGDRQMTVRVTVELMQAFLAAFNRHDLDAIMDYFADECVFYMPRGVGPRGDKYVGKADVRAGLAKRFEGIPDVHYGDDAHWVGDDFGVSEWTLTGTSLSGENIRVRGVDLLEFANGKITRKDAFWKIVT